MQTIKFSCFSVISFSLFILLTVGLFIGGYFFNWSWTGFANKTLWDWLLLLVIPVIIAVSGYLFTSNTSKNERRIALDNQQENALQAYFDNMSELLLNKHLKESPPSQEVLVIARSRTATVLRMLNPVRCASIIQFLSQAGILKLCVQNSPEGSFNWSPTNQYSLVEIQLPETNLNSIDLSNINLENVNLYRASLRDANLEKADLGGANLQRANFTYANLQNANLSGANLQGARLFKADLRGANLTGANLEKANLFDAKIDQLARLENAKSLKGAIMPDRSTHF